MQVPIEFIIHFRQDTEERKKNLTLILQYYRAIIPGCRFTIIEDNNKSSICNLQAERDVQYIFLKNTGSHNKCKGYNIGLKKSSADIICFLDVDCIVSIDNIKKAIETVNTTSGICIGYNGVCLYFKYNIKRRVIEDGITNLYTFLNQFIDKQNIYTSFENDFYHVANTRAVGGVLFGKREIFNKIKGFNPHFQGWGYEDNEIIERAKKLKIPLMMINTVNPYLFHLPHIDTNKMGTEPNHDHFKGNYEEYIKVVKMSMEELQSYIQTW